MASRIQWLGAERATRPTGSDHRTRPLGESPGSHRIAPDSKGVRARCIVVADIGNLIRFLDHRVSLNHDPGRALIPTQGHRSDPELLDDGHVQRVDIGKLGRCAFGNVYPGFPSGCLQPAHLVQQLIDSLSQDADLLLLGDDAGDGGSLPDLDEEGAFTGHADGSDHETIRFPEVEHLPRHAFEPTGQQARSP